MKKTLLAPLCALSLLVAPISTTHAWNWRASFDFDFKDSAILPIVGAGLAAAGVVGLASWLLSESDYDVINKAQRELEKTYHTFSDIWYVYERYPHDAYAQDEHVKALIGQQYSHEKFYLINCRNNVGTHIACMQNQTNKVKQRINKVGDTLARLSRYDEKYQAAKATRKQLTTLLKNLKRTAAFLNNLHQRIGSWPEYAYQQKRYKKHLKKLERQRKEKERERKLRDQQWELDRLQGRVRQLEREARTAHRCTECREPNCIHLRFEL